MIGQSHRLPRNTRTNVLSAPPSFRAALQIRSSDGQLPYDLRPRSESILVQDQDTAWRDVVTRTRSSRRSPRGPTRHLPSFVSAALAPGSISGWRAQPRNGNGALLLHGPFRGVSPSTCTKGSGGQRRLSGYVSRFPPPTFFQPPGRPSRWTPLPQDLNPRSGTEAGSPLDAHAHRFL